MSSNNDRDIMVACLTEARTSLQVLTKAGITELMTFRKPPLSIIYILEGLTVLLAPSKRMSDWYEIKKWLGTRVNELLTMLMNFNTDQVSEEQLEHLKTILARPECDSERVRCCSLAGYQLCLWLKGIANYSIIQRQYQQSL
ncbi:unnamed protein product [Rotaria sp. Silwood1]|nr:unnamed protein product [Rotaria sp. Silwood1]CAF4586822.1 unnamed protein product [Rotaria sp. Silwood1]